MAHNKNNINTLKESASKNENSSASAPKFKAMLVKDLLRSFEKPNNTIITESTQKNKANSSKIAEPYQKLYCGSKPLNFEGSSKKSTFKSSEMASNNVNQIVTQKSQKTETKKLDKSAKKDTCANFTIPPYQPKSKSFLNLHNAKSVSSKKQNLTAPCNCTNRIQQFSHNSAPKSDVTNTVGIMQNIVAQLKTFLEQSVQVHEDQASKLKQILDSVKVISNAINTNINESKNDFSACDRKDIPEVATSTKNSLKTNLKINTLNHSSPVVEINKGSSEKNKKAQRTEITQSIPLVKLVSNDDLNQKARQLSVDHLDSLSKAVSENQINCIITNAKTPKSQKHRTIAERSCKYQGRRRSLSMPSESDLDITEGSFTMLEKKLNILYKKVPTKSCQLVSSTNVSPSTPSFATQWDKRSKQPLKEYMARKMNSAFLVTPDVNWFQSRLESTNAGDFYSESRSPDYSH